jgi:4-amino-4-deoxy-L-arabinose transferase-like glycosyltransferase
MTVFLAIRDRALQVIVGLFVVCGLIYSVSSPIFEVSDEVRHVAMIEHYALGRGFPIQNPQRREFYEQEGSQPPLYYLLSAGLAQFFDISDLRDIAQFNPHTHSIGRADATDNRNQMLPSSADTFLWQKSALFVHVLRLIGVLMGAITVGCAYIVGANLVQSGQSHTIGLLSAGLVAFNPMFVFISASVNNDNLVVVCASLAGVLALRILKNGFSWRRSIVLGILLGCAALTKASGLALVGVIPIALLAHWLGNKVSREPPKTSFMSMGALISHLCLIGGLTLAIAGWWYARNYALYGDATGTQMMAQIAGLRKPVPTWRDLMGEWDGFYKAYWGLFGAVNIAMHPYVYRALEFMLALSLFGLGHIIWQKRGRFSAAWLMGLGIIGVMFVALLRWTSLTPASQGRLLFPAIVFISAFISIGFNAIVPRRLWRWVVGGLCGALAMLTLFAPIIYIQPVYTLPLRFANEGALGAVSFVRTEHYYAAGMRWLGYSIDTDSSRVMPGGTLGLTLYWQATQPITKNYSTSIKLYARDGAEVAALDTYPGGGLLPTRQWRVGEVIADHYWLKLRNNISAPTALQMDVGFYDFDDLTRTPLPTSNSGGAVIGRQRYEIAGVGSGDSRDKVLARVESIAPKSIGAFTFDTTWQKDVAVYLSVVNAEQSSNKLRLITHWVVMRDFNEDYTIFAQLFDANGKLVGQKDGRAVNGQFSTQWWREGDFVIDAREIDLPDSLPSGDYHLLMGLYRISDVARVNAILPSGEPAKDNALIYRLRF